MSESVVWPNIALLEGRLFALGAPIVLPDGIHGFDVTGRRKLVGGRRARPLGPCVATNALDRAWLALQTQAGYWPVVIAYHVLLLPSTETDRVWRLQAVASQFGNYPFSSEKT